MLDLRTILFSYVISNTICLVVIFSLWRQNRSRATGIGFWLADFFLQVLAVLLIVLRGIVPEFFSIIIGTPSLIGGTLLLYIGLERYVGKVSSQIHNYILVAIGVAVHLYFTYFEHSLMARNINFSLVLLILSFQIGWLMLRRVNTRMRSVTSRVGIIFFLYGAVSLFRIIVDLLLPPSNDLFKSGLYDTLVILIYQMLFIALTFALFLMVNGRLFADLIDDIGQRESAEAAHRKSEEKFAHAFNNIPDALVISAISDGQIIAVNEGFYQISGYTREETFGRSTIDLNLWVNLDERARFLTELQRLGKVRDFEAIFRKKSGEHMTGLIFGETIQLPEGLCVLNVIRDITERKRVEEELAANSASYRLLFNGIGEAIMIQDRQGNFLDVNTSAEHLYGYARNVLIGANPMMVFAPEKVEPAKVWERIEGAFAGEAQHFESWGKHANGEIFPIEIHLTQGAYFGQVVIIAAILDISKRKAQEGAILAAQTELERLLEESDLSRRSLLSVVEDQKAAEEKIRQRVDELYVLNSIGRQINLTLSLGEIVGKSIEAISSALQPDLTFVFLREGERLVLKGIAPANGRTMFADVTEHRVGECMCGLAVKEGKILFSRDIFSDVRCTWEECRRAGLRSFAALPLRSGEETIGVIGLATETERDFEQRAAFLETLANQLSIGIRNVLLYEQATRQLFELNVIHEAGQRLRYLHNPEKLAQEITKVLSEIAHLEFGAILLIDESTKQLVPFALDDRGQGPLFVEADKNYIASHGLQLGKGITGWVAQSGESVRSGNISQDARYIPMREGIQSELCVPLKVGDITIGVVNIETERPNAYTEADQRLLETLAAQISIAIQNANLLKEVQLHARQLEERVQDRTAQLQAANQELETFAYSVSHDLRAPLRAMEGFSSTLLSQYSDKLDEQGNHYLRRIQQAAQRMGQLINDILRLSRITRSELSRRIVDLSVMAREISINLLESDSQREVEFNISDGLVVTGDPNLLKLVIQNLLENAWKFSSTRQRACIDMGILAQETSERENKAGESTVYFIRDNGVGFDMAYAEKLFAPFQRLHSMEEFPGTGIGLAIVKRIITRHGGHIWPSAKLDHGATFYFTLGEG